MADDTTQAQTPADSLELLLVEDNQDDVQMFVDLISDHVSSAIELALATRLDEAIEEASNTKYDVILLDLSLPDSTGMDTYHKMQEHANGAAIVILTGLDDDDMAIHALSEGVQDYIVKGKADGSLLMRSIRYAIERNHLIAKLKEADQTIQKVGEEKEEADKTIQALSSILPVCSSCKKVHSEDDDTWYELDKYLRSFTKTKVKQTLCPTCGRRFR